MFCRAMDSKRSVMADKDETENREQPKMLKLPINHFECYEYIHKYDSRVKERIDASV